MYYVQAIVSFCEDAGDVVKHVKAGNHVFTFLLKGPIYLLSVQCNGEPSALAMLKLEYLYNQIVFILTAKGLGVLDRKPNYDLRDLLGGTENVMQGLAELDSNKGV